MKRFLLPFLVIILSFLAFFHPIATLQEDLGRHVLLGNIILQTRHVPHTNLLSFTYPNSPFINSHWLSEVIFALFFQQSGAFNLLLLTTFLGIATFFLLFLYITRRFGFFPSIITFLVTLLLFYQRTEVRPQVFSYFLTALFLFILYINREKSTKWVYLLIPLELLWANLHIYFFLGPLLVLLFLLEAIPIKSPAKPLLFVLFGSLIATLFNPNLLQGAIFPLTFWQNYGLPIGENVSSLFALQHFVYPPVYLFFTELSLITILLIIYRKKTTLLDWLLASTFSIIGLVAVRNLPLFALGIAIPFTKMLFLTKQSLFSKKLSQFHFIFSILQTSFVAFLTVSIISIFTKQGFGYGIREDYKPGIDFFIKQNLSGPMFNNFDIGSYLDYRLYPKERVFVDNRPEAYSANFFKQTYLPMETSPNRFYQVDKTYHFQTIIFSKEDQSKEGHMFLVWVNKDKQWKKVYEDRFVVIFKRV